MLVYPNVQERLKEMGITQAELAARIDVNATFLNKMLHGHRPLEEKLQKQIAIQLEADPRWLFDQGEASVV